MKTRRSIVLCFLLIGFADILSGCATGPSAYSLPWDATAVQDDDFAGSPQKAPPSLFYSFKP